MTPLPEVHVSASDAGLANDVARRLIPALVAAQQARGRAVLALTAGSIMELVWRVLAVEPTAVEVDWSKVDIVFGDERFVPAGSDDRNDRPALELCFGKEPFSNAGWYPMPPSDGDYGDDLDAAAAGYAQTLAGLGTIDVVLLGIGPDGHCCSLFPNHPSASDVSATVIAVRESPKPPPLRVSLSFDGLNSARQIWVVASGAGKADAVRAALGGADRTAIPSAGARGTERTIWFLDQAAATGIHAG